MISICFITCRLDPKFDWFFRAIIRQAKGDFSRFKIIVVDFYHEERYKNGAAPWWTQVEGLSVKHVVNKPNVWNGPHRLTKENWFAASSHRNTALLYCDTPKICFVDDLSVPCEGYLDFVLSAATQSDRVYLGSYRKVKSLIVKDGVIESCEEFPQGKDCRWDMGSDVGPVKCEGNLLFGCSLLLPVEYLLTINGWPEFVDGLGFEDCLTGLALQQHGFKFSYCRQMLTTESWEDHFIEKPFRREDYGVSPRDKSNAALNMVKNGCKTFPGYYEGGIRKMREEVLAGNPPPIVRIPEHCWFTGQPLSDL